MFDEKGCFLMSKSKYAILSYGVALFVMLVCYLDTGISLVQGWWSSDEHSHGVLVPFLVIYMIWLKRDVLPTLDLSPSILGFVLLFGMVALQFVAMALDVIMLEQTVFVALIPSLALALLGWKLIWVLFFPLFYLIFATPVWELAAPHLQDITTMASVGILKMVGVPIFVETNYITIPEGEFLIAEACGGLRFVIAACAISTLYAYLNFKRVYKQVVFVAAALVGAVVLNWLRVVVVILIGHINGMAHPMVADHYSLGWWMFAFALFPLFYFGARLGCDYQEVEVKVAPAQGNSIQERGSLRVFLWTAGAIIVLVSAPMFVYWMSGYEGPVGYKISAPVLPSPWSKIKGGVEGWSPSYKGASQELLATYTVSNSRIRYYNAYFAKQHQGAELISEVNRPFDNSKWKLEATSLQYVTIDDASLSLAVNEIELSNGHGRARLIWYWYRVSGSNATSGLVAKLLELKKLFAPDMLSLVFAIEHEYDVDLEKPRDAMAEFLVQAYAQMIEI